LLGRYLDGLVGPWPAAEKVYKERSPIDALDKFDKPVAFFQVSAVPGLSVAFPGRAAYVCVALMLVTVVRSDDLWSTAILF
jgi:hypothetical protein